MTTNGLIRLFLYVILIAFFLVRFETAIAENKDCEEVTRLGLEPLCVDQSRLLALRGYASFH